MQNPASTDEYYVNTAILVLLQQLVSDMRQLATEPLDRRLDFRGLDIKDLDWLVDRLSLKLYSRQSGSVPTELMEARLDGYLCKRRYKRATHGQMVPVFNNLPLAIVEAKAYVRRAAGSAIRWQESAEMAS